MAKKGPEANAYSRGEIILDRFLAIERDLGLLEFETGDFPAWELLRYPIYLSVLRQRDLHDPSIELPRRSLSRYLRRILLIVLCLTSRSPLRAPKNALLFLGHPRRKFENGTYVDIYTDPVLELLPKSYRYAVLEKPLNSGTHRQPARTVNLYYADALMELANLRRKWRRVDLPQDTLDVCHEVTKEFNRRLGVNIDVERMLRDALSRWNSQIPIFKQLFRRLRPKALLVVVSAGNETAIVAAKSLGIPTAELQHGSPAAGKLNYDFPRGFFKRTFADYFLSFGAFWTANVHLPLPAERIIPLGFPYVAQKLDKYSHIKRQNQLVVLSQPTVAKFLAPFVATLVPHLKGRVRIVYKMHPSEYNTCGNKYADLVKLGVEVVSDANVELYELMASSRWQLGVYSTALYEGLAFSCETFVLDAPGAEFVLPLIDRGLARLVRDPKDMVLNSGCSRVGDCSSIFSPISRNSIESTIERIVKGHL